jgi:hypothetical protein
MMVDVHGQGQAGHRHRWMCRHLETRCE